MLTSLEMIDSVKDNSVIIQHDIPDRNVETLESTYWFLSDDVIMQMECYTRTRVSLLPIDTLSCHLIISNTDIGDANHTNEH